MTNKLGRYIGHVAGIPSDQLHLVDADKTTKDWLTITTSGIAVASLAASQVEAIKSGDSASGDLVKSGSMDILTTNQATEQRATSIREAQSEAIAGWHDRLRLKAFSLIQGDRVNEIKSIEEELLLETQE